jgi:Tfp pilus assembly protein FimV
MLALVVLAVLAVLAVRLVIALSDIGGSPRPEPLDGSQAPVAGQHHVVRPGDTLWTIATQLAPDADPRPVVDALREANGGPVLEVGSRLTLPPANRRP